MKNQEYSGFGLSFRYPADWSLSEEIDDEQASITVRSPETAFWSATVIRHRPDPRSVLRAALRAYQEEYHDSDVTEMDVDLGDHRVRAARVNFICLELTNTARLQVMQTPQSTVLLLYQLNDAELTEMEQVLEQITASLEIDAD